MMVLYDFCQGNATLTNSQSIVETSPSVTPTKEEDFVSYDYKNGQPTSGNSPDLSMPTVAQLRAFKNAYEYFNKVLFDCALPGVLLNFSRRGRAFGFAAKSRWRSAKAKPGTAGTIHELSLNPKYLNDSIEEVYGTLVHEQCHIWQFEYGKPSRNGYHNKEWVMKMVAVGLFPSTTGKKVGKMTGQSVSHYPLPGGRFLKALEMMPMEYRLPLVSTENELFAPYITGQPSPGAGEPLLPTNNKNKTKYTCPGCSTNVWGKPLLNIICGECGHIFEAINFESF